MSVLAEYIKSIAISRSQYIQKWEERKNTVLEHIIKELLIIDDSDRLDEIDTRALELSRVVTKGRISTDTYLGIYEDYCFEDQFGIVGVIRSVIRDFCLDSKNKTHTASVREWESRLKEVESQTNALFKRFIELVENAKETQQGEYLGRTIPNDPQVKAIVKKAHAIKAYKVWKCNANSPKKELSVVREVRTSRANIKSLSKKEQVRQVCRAFVDKVKAQSKNLDDATDSSVYNSHFHVMLGDLLLRYDSHQLNVHRSDKSDVTYSVNIFVWVTSSQDDSDNSHWGLVKTLPLVKVSFFANGFQEDVEGLVSLDYLTKLLRGFV